MTLKLRVTTGMNIKLLSGAIRPCSYATTTNHIDDFTFHPEKTLQNIGEKRIHIQKHWVAQRYTTLP